MNSFLEKQETYNESCWGGRIIHWIYLKPFFLCWLMYYYENKFHLGNNWLKNKSGFVKALNNRRTFKAIIFLLSNV